MASTREEAGEKKGGEINAVTQETLASICGEQCRFVFLWDPALDRQKELARRLGGSAAPLRSPTMPNSVLTPYPSLPSTPSPLFSPHLPQPCPSIPPRLHLSSPPPSPPPPSSSPTKKLSARQRSSPEAVTESSLSHPPPLLLLPPRLWEVEPLSRGGLNSPIAAEFQSTS